MNNNDTSSSLLEFQTPTLVPHVRSERGKQIVEWFGLTVPPERDPPSSPIPPDDLRKLLPEPGQIVLIGGPSGAGKSSLLRAMRTSAQHRRWIDLHSIRLPDESLVDCFSDLSMQQVLLLLSQVGLAEAWTYLRTPAELSDGQRWRLRLAAALAKSRFRRLPIVICDEFCALLDRVTAVIVSRALRRAVEQSPIGVIVATSHDDLVEALIPDVRVQCDFGVARVERLTQREPGP
ncbi:MAG TPA: hypothetical protein VHD56_01935 [Tepidisphaeraceae bacterium]|nr:hypothetical protein [Tepidisphaeraceae bacterium]